MKHEQERKSGKHRRRIENEKKDGEEEKEKQKDEVAPNLKAKVSPCGIGLTDCLTVSPSPAASSCPTPISRCGVRGSTLLHTPLQTRHRKHSPRTNWVTGNKTEKKTVS